MGCEVIPFLAQCELRVPLLNEEMDFYFRGFIREVNEVVRRNEIVFCNEYGEYRYRVKFEVTEDQIKELIPRAKGSEINKVLKQIICKQ